MEGLLAQNTRLTYLSIKQEMYLWMCSFWIEHFELLCPTFFFVKDHFFRLNLKLLIFGTASYFSVQISDHFYWLICKKVCLTSCRHLSKAILGTLPVLKQKYIRLLIYNFDYKWGFLWKRFCQICIPFLFLDLSFMKGCTFLKYKQNIYFSTCQNRIFCFFD